MVGTPNARTNPAGTDRLTSAHSAPPKPAYFRVYQAGAEAVRNSFLATSGGDGQAPLTGLPADANGWLPPMVGVTWAARLTSRGSTIVTVRPP